MLRCLSVFRSPSRPVLSTSLQWERREIFPCTIFRAYASRKKRQKKRNFDEYPIETIRNMGIIAHVDAGKTTTAERMLYLAGEVAAMGDVDSGNTKMDFLEMERERGITIQSAAISFVWDDCRINMIDTPGHVDFQGEVERSVRVLDGAVAILDAVHGVQAQTHTIWRQAERYKVPRIVYFNKMDRDDASVERGMKSLEERLGVDNLVSLQLPIGSAETFKGVIDLVEQTALEWPKNDDIHNYTEQPVTEGHPMYQKMLEAREELLTKLADHDDSIIEAYSEHGVEVDPDTVHKSIRKLLADSLITPVLCGSSFKCKGVQPLLDAVTRYLPSPMERPPLEAQNYMLAERVLLDSTSTVLPNHNDLLCALAFKVVHDTHRGMIVYVRLYRGSFHCGMKLQNVTRNTGERVITIMRIGAESLTLINNIKAGDICALVGMKQVHTGDTLIAAGDMKRFKRKPVPMLVGMEIPPPVFTCAVESADERKEAYLLECLDNLSKEDPSFRFTTDKESGQLLMSGMGELHLDILKDRLLNHYKVDAWIGKMRVSYRTTISEVLDKEFEYAYEFTGRQQRATVWLRLDPLVEGDQILDNRILYLVPKSSWDAIPMDLQPDVKDAIREGVENVFRCGPIYSFPLHGVRAVIRDIEWHDDSTPNAFRACVSRMIRDMIKETAVSILQPVMQVEVSVPEGHFGTVLADISNHRKGNVQRVEEGANTKEKIITAEVPLKSMMGYSTAVRSVSQGTASFTMDFLRYGELTDSEVTQLHKEYRG